jgi:thiamine biosynthesis lipoprotein
LGFSGAKAEEDMKESSRSEFLMDTFVSVRAVGPNPEQATQAAFSEMERIESLMSRYIPDSDVSCINEGAGGGPVKVSEETFCVIEEAIKCASLTNGAFDITIGPLMDVWGFGAKDPAIPDTGEIEQACSLVGWELLELDPVNRTVRLPIQGMSIDLGGIAKGYAAREGARILREHGISHALIDAGGNIVTVGFRPDGEPWKIGIRNPRGESIEDTIGPTLSIVNGAVATSGDYERFFVHDGRRCHHILHPDTGMPVESAQSVTVLADDSLYADMLSTAVFVLGPDEGMEFIDNLDGVSAMIVDSDGNVLFSKGFPEMR